MGSSGCLYFFNILSAPVVNISPLGSTSIYFWSRSVLNPYISQFSSSYLPLSLVLTGGGPFIIKIPKPIQQSKCSYTGLTRALFVLFQQILKGVYGKLTYPNI